jgi:TonB-dependent starch-binding outer membrane protein SusC
MVGSLLELVRGRLGPPAGLALMLGLALVLPASVEAQGTITGIVRAQGSMRPLDAAQVFIPGTGVGTLTNAGGRFLLPNVPTGERTLRVELVGYAASEVTVTVTAGETAVVEVELAQSAIELDQIVVTGAGQATQRRMLGNTVATLNVESTVERAPIQNMSEVLQGREPGVLVTQTGGMAGEGSTIRIRGSSSLSQSNEPIIYVDGVRVDNSGGYGGVGATSRLNDINPEAIARIEVLKGAAAATLYGTEASNGVIQIFTKQGSSGTPRWELSVEQGFAQQDMSRYALHAGFARNQADADRLRDFWGLNSLAPYEVFETDIFGKLFETGYHQAYALSVRGGSDFINYFVSGRYSHEDGSYGAEEWGPGRDLDEKKQATANVTIFPTQNLRLRFNSMFVQSMHEIPSNGNDTNGGFSLALMSKPERGSPSNLTGSLTFATVKETMYIQRIENVDRFSGSVAANYTPIQNLAVDLTVGIDAVNQQGETFRPFGWNVDGVSSTNTQGSRAKNDVNRREVTFDGKATWNKDFGTDFTSNTVFGAQLIRSESNSLTGTGTQFPAPGLSVAEAGANQTIAENRLTSVNAGAYLQEQLGYRNYLFATVGLRFDKHSAFGTSAGAALYPKFSLSFVPSDLPGWNSETLSAFRLRGAIGQSGLQPGAFDKFTTFSPLASSAGPGVQPQNLGNPDLKPEVSTEWEFGTEVGLFSNRAALNFTYWNRTVTDVLVARQFPPSGGFTNTQLDNLGELKAWGLEIGLNGGLINRPRFSLSGFANASYLHEEVTDLGGAPPIKVEYFRYGTWIAEGYAPGAFFSVKLADTDLPFDTNGDGQGDTRDQLLNFFSTPRAPDAIRLLLAGANPDGPDGEYYRGKPQPTWQGAVGFDLDFLSNFRVSSLFEYKVGNTVQDISSGFRTAHAALGRNTRETAAMEAVLVNPSSTAEQRLEAALLWANNYANFTPYERLNQFKKGDLVRWRELSVTYDVPVERLDRIGADRLSITAAARNLMLFTGYDGIDPESNVVARGNFVQGIDGWRPGTPRRFTLSARVGF